MPKVMLPLAAQPLWMPTDVLAAGPWEPVCAPVRLAAAASSVSFASIPAAFVMFRLRAEIIKDGTTASPLLRFNNDSGANYSRQYVIGSSTSVSGARATGQTSISHAFEAIGANEFATMDLIIAKPIAGAAALTVELYAVSQTNLAMAGVAGIWSNTADLINRIDIISNGGDFAAGSIFILEGSKF